jgi:hypothetical protein
MNLLGKGDLKVCRLRHQGSSHFFITPSEQRAVGNAVGESAYFLYSYYRTGWFNQAEDFDDNVVGLHIGWNARKVQKHRLMLEQSNLFRSIRYGTKADGVTKVFVGEDVVALFEAGLPADILDGKAFQKLKRALKITNTEELIANAELMVGEYNRNPELYK